jgi:hypothetical protein
MTRTLSPLALGYSILAGPVLWFVHLLAVYNLTEFGCRVNFNNLLFITPSTIQILILIITVVILVMVGVGAFLAYRSLRESDLQEGARLHFLVMMGVLLSSLFLFIIVVTAMPTFFVSVCDGVA